MKISILISVYNLEGCLEETLTSVFAQKTDYRFEVLIGDDGSTDGTLDIAKKWRCKYPDTIRIYTMPREKGRKYNSISRASQNRINLLKHAEGEYVTFLDGDDVYTDNKKIQKQVDILEDVANADCIMCGCDMNLWWKDENRVTPMASPDLQEGKISAKEYWEKYGVPAEAFVFRNIQKIDVIPKVMLDYFDDNIITYFYLKFGKIYYLKDNMVNYRQNSTNWKSINQLEKNIINAMDLSVERKHNIKLYFSSVRRHYDNFASVFKVRKQLSGLHLEGYIHQAEKDDLKEIKTILEYSSKGLLSKSKAIALYGFMSMICYRKTIHTLYHKIYWTYWNPVRSRIVAIHKK